MRINYKCQPISPSAARPSKAFSLPLFLSSNLTQIGIGFTIIGFVNIWIYLSRIDQLNLLSSLLSTPTTLLTVFASMSFILLLWILMVTFPTWIYLWMVNFDKSQSDAESIAKHSLIISIPLAIFGAYSTDTAISAAIFVMMFYACYFCYRWTTRNLNKSLTIFIKGITINMIVIIIFGFIYNKASLSIVARPVRVAILLSYLIIIYIPIFLALQNIRNKKTNQIKSIFIILTTTIILMTYISTNLTNGLVMKMNDYTMTIAGLRSDDLHWFNVKYKDYPPGWLHEHWNVTDEGDLEVWLQGFILIQSNTIVLICPQPTLKSMREYTSAHLTFHNDLPPGSMSSSSCILKENTPDVHIRGNTPSKPKVDKVSD